jgi:hypothetical protein
VAFPAVAEATAAVVASVALEAEASAAVARAAVGDLIYDLRRTIFDFGFRTWDFGFFLKLTTAVNDDDGLGITRHRLQKSFRN